jgi:hypothetical protein
MPLLSSILRSQRTRPPTAVRRRRSRFGSLASASADRPAIATGRDLSAREAPRPSRAPSRAVWIACAVGGLVAALLLVQLRTESIELRYRLARSLKTEQRLLEEQRRSIVELRQMRHPVRLAALGTELGLARPHEMVELPALEEMP